MMNLFCGGLISLLLTFCAITSSAQYTLNGSAVKLNCNCYSLTDSVNNDSGSVFSFKKINLDSSFDFHFNVFPGCKDTDGADGIVFILQTVNTSVGANGEGLGFMNVTPSVGISLDTWQNPGRNDPSYDHISIQLNGNITHGSDLAGPVPASATSDNIEDCNWHVFRISWDAASKTLSTWFDGVFRLKAQYDLVKNVFNNDPMVYWGFSGATGGYNNVQKFCTELDSRIQTNLVDSFTCLGSPILFKDSSESFTAINNFYWDFGDGNTSSMQNPGAHYYQTAGSYKINHMITSLDGCSDTLSKTIEVGSIPVAAFSLFDTCTNKYLGIRNQSGNTYGNAAVGRGGWTERWYLLIHFLISITLSRVHID